MASFSIQSQFIAKHYQSHVRLCFFYSGVPAVVDFAAMRDAVKRLGGDPEKINPICPADLVIDHSVQVDVARRLVKYRNYWFSVCFQLRNAARSPMCPNTK